MKIKDSLVVYLPQRIIMFPLHLYINSLITRVLNRLYEWDIHTSKKISGKEKYFNHFLEKEILDILSEIKIVYKDLNLKIFTFYIKCNISETNQEFLSLDNCVIKKVLKTFNKVCGKYFIKNIPKNIYFKPSEKSFKNIKCGVLTGEELEFLVKLTND